MVGVNQRETTAAQRLIHYLHRSQGENASVPRSPEEQIRHQDRRHHPGQIRRQPTRHGVPGAPDAHRAEVHRQHVEGGLGAALDDAGQATGEGIRAVDLHGLDHHASGAAAAQR